MGYRGAPSNKFFELDLRCYGTAAGGQNLLFATDLGFGVYRDLLAFGVCENYRLLVHFMDNLGGISTGFATYCCLVDQI